ncbi:MAG: hypothetical protein RRZ66_02765, partial [Bacteroidales bacterium]
TIYESMSNSGDSIVPYGIEMIFAIFLHHILFGDSIVLYGIEIRYPIGVRAQYKDSTVPYGIEMNMSELLFLSSCLTQSYLMELKFRSELRRYQLR